MAVEHTEDPARVLVTGAGGAAGIAVIRALSPAGHAVYAADCDPLATGLHIVPRSRRCLLPRGDDPRFASALLGECRRRGIDVVVPTVDEELRPLADARHLFAEHGVVVLSSEAEALATCLDKHALVEAVRGIVPCPATELLDPWFEPEAWIFPVIVKPRTGRGGAGVELVADAAGLDRFPHDGSHIVQEHLPGEEYSVDVLVDHGGAVVAAVPRVRLRVESGVAVVARTVRDADLEAAAGRCAQAAGIRGGANVQFRRDADGVARLLEINPRFPGTLAITVASGVNLPTLALADALGVPLPDDAGVFAEIGMVRMLEDVVVDVRDLEVPAASTSSPADTLSVA
ncbi:MAG: ATP-grasp domain-containing protein [Thermoleophilia bacterium]|nr:ATP-grasp domain-containing protein [Thermoleophilia bacterium]